MLSCRNYLVPDDFLGFLPPDKAAAAFHYIDDNDSGRVAQSELLNAVVQIFRCWVVQQAPKPCKDPLLWVESLEIINKTCGIASRGWSESPVEIAGPGATWRSR
jgi:hypothetical protein